MSFAVDVNLLIYASDSGSPFHRASREFLDETARGREICCVAWVTAMSYLRIVTHPGILGSPLTPDEALANLRSLAELPQVRMLAEKEGLLDAYAEVTGGEPLRGKLVPDAHLAAILLQHDVRTLCTHDADFRRFRTLSIRDPLAS